VLEDPAILLENVYNVDETGVMLCMLGSIQVLVSKDDPRHYRGAGVKRTMVTAVECSAMVVLRSLLGSIGRHRCWPAGQLACSSALVCLEKLGRVDIA
jgi:hypothetical protein